MSKLLTLFKKYLHDYNAALVALLKICLLPHPVPFNFTKDSKILKSNLSKKICAFKLSFDIINFSLHFSIFLKWFWDMGFGPSFGIDNRIKTQVPVWKLIMMVYFSTCYAVFILITIQAGIVASEAAQLINFCIGAKFTSAYLLA